jgi:hypothetical protein
MVGLLGLVKFFIKIGGGVVVVTVVAAAVFVME